MVIFPSRGQGRREFPAPSSPAHARTARRAGGGGGGGAHAGRLRPSRRGSDAIRRRGCPPRGRRPCPPLSPIPAGRSRIPPDPVHSRRRTLLPANRLPAAILVGFGATLAIDLWALLLKRAFGIPSLDFRLLGRWILHMPAGTFVHKSIGAAPPRRFERAAGWVAHYLIGASLALGFVLLAPDRWLEEPTLLPALAYGIVTVLAPFLVLQPALGLGIASSRTPRPGQARLKSLATHGVFGLGLYAWARLLAGIAGP
ncbi:MAG: DUF2938 domain-containing protein [Planctomycetaceae bacterium]|nr:DUF2938 domain-containing protein [Planctomycetaceae bacterium]